MTNKNTNSLGAIIVGLLLAAIIIGTASIYFGFSVYYHNKAVAMEENIAALSNNSESVLSNGTMTILDKAKIKDSYAADFKESLRITMEGRYGNDQNVAMKWVQENSNNALDSAIYKDISSYIEGMRRDFQISQKQIVDSCRSYRIMQRSAFSGFFLKGDFPSTGFNQDVMCSIVSDAKTRKAFETKQQTSIL